MIEDGKGERFIARFPFSFFLINVLEAQRRNHEGFSNRDRVRAMHYAFEQTLNLPDTLKGSLPEPLLRAYAYDLMCTATMEHHAPVVDRDVKAQILWRLFCMAGAKLMGPVVQIEAPSLLTTIHARLWAVEERFRVYCALANLHLSVQVAIEHALNATSIISNTLDAGVVHAVITALIDDLLILPVTSYAAWLATVQRAFPLIRVLLTSVSGDSELVVIAEDAQASFNLEALAATLSPVPLAVTAARVQLLDMLTVLVRDAALPLHVDSDWVGAVCQQFMVLPPTQFRSAAALRILMSAFDQLNVDLAAMQETLGNCEICEEWPKDPVLFCARPRCRRVVCRGCADNHLARLAELGEGVERLCFHCREVGQGEHGLPRLGTLDARVLTERRRLEQQKVDLQTAAARTIEHYCLTACTGMQLDAPLEDDLVRTMVELLVKPRSDVLVKQLDYCCSDAARTGMLTALQALPHSTNRELVRHLLSAAIEQEIRTGGGRLDSRLGVCYAIVNELTVSEDYVDAACLLPNNDAPVLQRLEAIAQARRLIAMFAADLCTTIDPPAAEGPASVEVADAGAAVLEVGNGILTCAAQATRLQPVLQTSRAVRMYLLRLLHNRRGEMFVKSCLSQSPLAQQPWLQEWVASGEVGLIRFIGNSKLPRSNPLKGLPSWGPVHAAVFLALTTGAIDDLTTQATTVPAAAFRAALLGAVFQEIFFLNLLPRVHAEMHTRIQAFRAWLMSPATLALPPFATAHPLERSLIQLIAGCPAAQPNAASNFLTVTPESSPEHISLVLTINFYFTF